MAELHIQRERNRSWVIWLTAILLIVGAVAWWAFGNTDEADTADLMPPMTGTSLVSSGETDATESAGATGAVNDYLRYVTASRAVSDADHGHAYTADGIRRLADALGALHERDGRSDENVRSRVAQLRERADALQRDPQSTEHARFAREAFDAAAELMHAMQTTASAAEVAEVGRAASALEPGRMLLTQREAVQRFFDRSGAALRTMAGAPAT